MTAEPTTTASQSTNRPWEDSIFAIAAEQEARTVTYLRDMLTLWLRKHHDSSPLSMVMLYLRTLTRDDALISRALADAQNHDTIRLDHRRVVYLQQPKGHR